MGPFMAGYFRLVIPRSPRLLFKMKPPKTMWVRISSEDGPIFSCSDVANEIVSEPGICTLHEYKYVGTVRASRILQMSTYLKDETP